MRLQPDTEHPHGLSDAEFDSLFTTSKPIVFAYHGYPWLIHRLTYRRTNHDNLHVRGYKEEGTTTTPFDMVMLNDLDRFHLVIDVIDRVPGLADRAAHLRQEMASGGSPRARTRASTATTIRRSATGRGRTDGHVLVVNAGSTSLKLSVVDADDVSQPSRRSSDSGDVAGVGHRVVHGGAAVRRADADRRRRRGGTRCARRARAAAQRAGRRRDQASAAGATGRPHVAVFDTAFHRTIPPVATTYACPRGSERWASTASASTGSRSPGPPSRCRWRGSSSATSAAAARSPPCATDGRSTRRWASRRSRACRWRHAPGPVDPGALLYLLRHGVTADELDDALEHESGLLGLGGTGDVATLDRLLRRRRAARARHLLLPRRPGGRRDGDRRSAASTRSAFTGGVGEHAAPVRAAICERLRFLGVGERVPVHVIAAREDAVVARAVRTAISR